MTLHQKMDVKINKNAIFPLIVLPCSPLVVQNYHINIPSGISQEPNPRGVMDVSNHRQPHREDKHLPPAH
jgi:hypothetical protein